MAAVREGQTAVRSEMCRIVVIVYNSDVVAHRGEGIDGPLSKPAGIAADICRSGKLNLMRLFVSSYRSIVARASTFHFVLRAQSS